MLDKLGWLSVDKTAENNNGRVAISDICNVQQNALPKMAQPERDFMVAIKPLLELLDLLHYDFVLVIGQIIFARGPKVFKFQKNHPLSPQLYCDESAEGGKTSRTGEKIVDKHRSVTAPMKHRIMS